MSMTFYNETLEAIKSANKLVTDVTFVGKRDGTEGMHWYEFVTCSMFNYDSGFGAAEIQCDLIIQFNDGSWLERGEYDGSEWWQYQAPLPKYAVHNSAAVILKRVDDSGYCYDGRYKLVRI